MKTPSGSCTFLTRLVFSVFSGIALAAFAVTADAAPNKFTCSIANPGTVTAGQQKTFTGTVSGGKPPYTVVWTFPNATPGTVTTPGVQPGNTTANTTFNQNAAGSQTVSMIATAAPGGNPKTCSASLQVTVLASVGGIPTARGDTYATPAGKTLTVQLSRVSGVLYNDFDTNVATGANIGNAGLTAQLISGPTHGSLSLNSNGSFTYTPDGSQGDNDNDSFTYKAKDADGYLSAAATVNIHIESDQPDFKIMMNYELGMHCTGFEFSYCCVLPPYNSILAQVVKPQAASLETGADYPRLLTADPNNGLDPLARETVLRDYDGAGNINKYYLEYFHDAQPRREGNMPGHFNDQTSTLISAVEGNSLLYWNTPYDSAAVDGSGKLVKGDYAGVHNVVLGNGDYTDNTDNFANGWLNHFYIYQDLEGTIPGGTSLEADKIRLGVAGMVEYPANSGAALQPMGPTGNGTPFDNVLTFSGDTGTVVYTQMKVLENLPVMLTSPHIWEALGMPLTPFEDSIDFFADPGKVDEDSIRPYVAMKARLLHAECNEGTGVCIKGDPVIGSNGQPVIGFGTAPIDIPNCERCHSVPAYKTDGVTPNVNSPSYVRRQNGPDPYYGPGGETLEAMVNLEINYWKAYYDLNPAEGDTDWYARLKGAAISIEVMHDYDVGTNFTANYPVAQGDNPLGLPGFKAAVIQNTRMGHESVICQKCHADNVIAVVKSACKSTTSPCPQASLVPPISEAIHNTHRSQSEGGKIVLNDGLGRDGGCQGCHPAHRSDGTMDNYAITLGGDSANATGDNRLNQGGCFVGRDVHSNPLKDVDGAETPAHLNAVGTWLADNVFRNQAGQAGNPTDTRGIWCTNCHTQLGQELWRKEDCNDPIHGDCLVNPRGQATLAGVAAAVGVSTNQAIAWLDPNNHDLHSTGLGDFTHTIWNPSVTDANVATIEVGPSGPVGTTDADGDFSVNILSFCTTTDCVAKINANKSNQSLWRYPANPFINTANTAVAVPFSAATDGRDHWLSAGEPHCADCHAAPYVEQSGNINAFPPFNYPAKSSLMRYTRGHQDLGCQACHESIHGLYPVSPSIDTTTYAQAAALNADGSHGPLKCGTCHEVDSNGIPTWIGPLAGGGLIGSQINGSFDNAVGWAHTYTAEASVLNSTCQNCHGVNGVFGSGAMNPNSTPAQWTLVASHSPDFLAHAMWGFTSRQMMDKAEILVNGSVTGTTDGSDGVCLGCHTDNSPELNAEGCDLDNEPFWFQHLTQGRVAESAWEQASQAQTGTNCGW